MEGSTNLTYDLPNDLQRRLRDRHNAVDLTTTLAVFHEAMTHNKTDGWIATAFASLWHKRNPHAELGSTPTAFDAALWALQDIFADAAYKPCREIAHQLGCDIYKSLARKGNSNSIDKLCAQLVEQMMFKAFTIPAAYVVHIFADLLEDAYTPNAYVLRHGFTMYCHRLQNEVQAHATVVLSDTSQAKGRLDAAQAILTTRQTLQQFSSLPDFQGIYEFATFALRPVNQFKSIAPVISALTSDSQAYLNWLVALAKQADGDEPTLIAISAIRDYKQVHNGQAYAVASLDNVGDVFVMAWVRKGGMDGLDGAKTVPLGLLEVTRKLARLLPNS